MQLIPICIDQVNLGSRFGRPYCFSLGEESQPCSIRRPSRRPVTLRTGDPALGGSVAIGRHPPKILIAAPGFSFWLRTGLFQDEDNRSTIRGDLRVGGLAVVRKSSGIAVLRSDAVDEPARTHIKRAMPLVSKLHFRQVCITLQKLIIQTICIGESSLNRLINRIVDRAKAAPLTD